MSNAAAINDQAHSAAAKVLSTWDIGTPMPDPIGCARVAAACDGYDPDGREGQLYVERFVGHVVNVQCGTAGR